MHQGLF